MSSPTYHSDCISVFRRALRVTEDVLILDATQDSYGNIFSGDKTRICHPLTIISKAHPEKGIQLTL